jgi:hypothetical protein
MMSYKVFIKVFIGYKDLFVKNYRVHGLQVQKNKGDGVAVVRKKGAGASG